VASVLTLVQQSIPLGKYFGSISCIASAVGAQAAAAWLRRAVEQMVSKVDPRGPVSMLPRCTGMLLAVLGGLLLLLLLGATVLVWKVRRSVLTLMHAGLELVDARPPCRWHTYIA
jgi:hypothetical protein